jgi:hypothetical protein
MLPPERGIAEPAFDRLKSVKFIHRAFSGANENRVMTIKFSTILGYIPMIKHRGTSIPALLQHCRNMGAGTSVAGIH